MCGICGWVDFSTGQVAGAPILQDMVAALRHRGPDDADVFMAGSAALGHTRLSILDLSNAGRQPMTSADGRFTIVYNGEVFNFKELRAELIRLGAKFASSGDTEVVLQAFAHWGADAIPKLNGIFGFAIWDRERERLYLVRDCFGVKPLYYRRSSDGLLVFASEIKAILCHAGEQRMDWGALHEFLHYGAGGLGSRTLFREIHKLEAGTFLVWTKAGVEVQTYWHPGMRAASLETGSGDPVAITKNLLEAAIRRQLVSDVPVGIFLSGGIDSSAVTAYATKHYVGKLQTYSVGFDFAAGSSELPKAAKVARHFGTEHHEMMVKGIDLPAVIEALVRCHDDAFSDAANIPLYLLGRELRGRLHVVLQGDGGDELFAGYRRYPLLAREAWLRPMAHAIRGPWRVAPFSRTRKRRVQRMIDIWCEPNRELRMALLMAQDECSPSPLRVLGEFARTQAAAHDPFSRYREIGRQYREIDSLQQMLWTDLRVLLPDIFLEKVDKSTMASAIEARVPFLDHELADYVIALPARTKLAGGKPKGLLKQVLRGVVPDFVLDAPKVGFSVPYGRWLAGPLAQYARDRICGGAAAQDGLLDARQIRSLMEDHVAKRDDHGFLLWKTLNLAIWYELYRPRLAS